MNRKARRAQEKAEKRAEKRAARQLRQNPDASPADIAMQAASRHFQAGDLDQAATALEAVVLEHPDHYDTTYGLGVIYAARGESERCIPLLARACDLKPDAADARFNLAKALEQTGRFDDALEVYADALSTDPKEVACHLGIGGILKDRGDLEGAAWSFNQVLEIEPKNDMALTNLGATLQLQGRLMEAEAANRNAVQANPANAVAHGNLGNVLHEMERLDDATASYRRAIKLTPNDGHVDAKAHHNLGLILLLQGKLSEGWAEYEWRLQAENRERAFTRPRWRGEDVKDKTILVWGEQGVGDEILFASQIPDLMAAGAGVVLESDARLVPLYQRSFAGARCIAKDTGKDADKKDVVKDGGAGDIDFQVPSGSLAQYLRPDFDSFTGGAAYLKADGGKRSLLRKKYKDGGGLLVGIAWHSGNERSGPKKSLTLADWAPLAKIPGVTLVDLQYGDWAADRLAFEKATGGTLLHDGGIDQTADLDAFAAQVAAMDLVITISNTTAHMAGALGVPVWVLLNTMPLNCWLLDRDDSPWYAAARLFRQTKPDDWVDVMMRAATALKGVAEG